VKQLNLFPPEDELDEEELQDYLDFIFGVPEEEEVEDELGWPYNT
jgi:hypothetical protein